MFVFVTPFKWYLLFNSVPVLGTGVLSVPHTLQSVDFLVNIEFCNVVTILDMFFDRSLLILKIALLIVRSCICV